MGLLSQRPFPLPMSIYDNIAYGPKIHGERDKKKLDEIVERYLKATALWDEVKDRLHAPATRLSIGQQQRLCLARGLAIEPEIILGDEPTSALDPVSTQHIEELFLKLKDNYTLVLVTHILRQARRVSDYIAFIYMGEIVEFGPTEELLLNPKEKMTKDYIRGYVS
jgi:phosphate transport system ATP-binding protein